MKKKKPGKRVGAVIAAAGMSSRMHEFKPLLKIGNIINIRRVIQTFQRAGVQDIVVVTGFQAELLERHIADMGITCVFNPDYENGEMFDSIKLGLKALQGKSQRILVTPADVPLVTEETVRTLLKSKALLAKPVFHNRGGHPLLLDESLVEEILSYPGKGGMKAALYETKVTACRVPVEEEAVVLDADTPEDFKRLCDYYVAKAY